MIAWLRAQVAKAERKMPWLKYKVKGDRFTESRQSLQQAKESLRRKEDELANATGPLRCATLEGLGFETLQL